MANDVLFGVNIDPSVDNLEEAFQRARIADEHGLDLATIQDHPYNRRYLDTWTLLTVLAARTERVHFGANVFCTPLRPPAMLAKKAASLSAISGGRVELGIGAGAYREGIAAFGGPDWSGPEAYTAFKDALHIIRGLLANADGSFTYEGDFYHVRGARFGPAPAQPIRIWVGATGSKMLRLTGQMADGILVSTTYVPPEELDAINRQIDEGVEAAGREPTDVRRGYNLMGVLDLGRADTRVDEQHPNGIYGPVDHWIEQILRFHRDHRQDTFIFWPIGGNELVQVEAFAQEVVPAVKEALAGG